VSVAAFLRPDGLALAPNREVRAVQTACGIVSGSERQTSWAIERARQRINYRWREPYTALTDADVVWLLVMGWVP
jgi:hypothetical protein